MKGKGWEDRGRDGRGKERREEERKGEERVAAVGLEWIPAAPCCPLSPSPLWTPQGTHALARPQEPESQDQAKGGEKGGTRGGRKDSTKESEKQT